MSTTEIPGADAAPSAPEPAPGSHRSELRAGGFALTRRLHFYAGLFVAPFILIAAITGALYALTPSLESVMNHDLLQVDSTGPARPLAAQVAAATAARSGAVPAAIDPAQHSGDTTRVLFDDPALGESERRAVFIDPATARPVGTGVVYGSSGALPMRTWIDTLHRNLHLGEPGRLYSELAASWLWVIASAGLLLWARRIRRPRPLRALWPARTGSTRARAVNRHAALGMWILVPLLFLSATGMTWSTHAGAHIDALRQHLSWTAPVVGTTLPGTATPEVVAGEHDHHGRATPAPVDRTDQVDGVLAAARAAGVDGPVEITVPPGPHTAYVVKERRLSWVFGQDAVAVDGATGQVSDTLRYADWPLMARLANWGIAVHMGLMFGLPNQLLLLAAMIALIVVIVRGYRMWWQRRPTRGDRFIMPAGPNRGVLRRIPLALALPIVLVAVLVGWFAPLLGISLLGFLIVDVLIGIAARRRAMA